MEPQPIKVTKVQPIFPARGQKSLVVKVKATLLEDGAIVTASPLAPADADKQYLASATESVRLWRYRPARRGGCPFPTIMTVTVAFESL